MNFLIAVILGLVQGVTEFLPISSSGHLAVLQNVFNVQDIGADHTLFSVLLHLATLVSVCIVYWDDIKGMVLEGIGFIRDIGHPKPDEGGVKPQRRLLFMIIIGILPLVIVLPFKSSIESLSSSTMFIGIAFLITGFMLLLSDKMQNGRKNEKDMSVKDALVVGVCQAVAVLPGISRSGATITSGMAVGFNRTFAVKFSFLMSLPAIIGANLLELIDVIGNGVDWAMVPMYLVGMVVAGVTGYFAIRLVKMLSQKGKFGKFCYYCFAAGIVTIVLTIIY